MKLKHNLNNFDFKQMLIKLREQASHQVYHFSKLIDHFKRLEGLNENEYYKLDAKFLNLLQSTRVNLIKTKNINYFHIVCEISKTLSELTHVRYNNKSESHHLSIKDKVIINMAHTRARIYCEQGYHYLEEQELLDILVKQSTTRRMDDYDPVIYHRLSYLSMLRGDFHKAINYINFSNKKYGKRSNKKIYRKAKALKSQLEQQTNGIIPFSVERKRMFLFQIANLLDKLLALKLLKNCPRDKLLDKLRLHGVDCWYEPTTETKE